jgi:HEAT repeat protein
MEERRMAAKALGESGRAQAVQPLIDLLIEEVVKGNGGDRLLHETASNALAKLGPPAVEPLMAAIKEHPSDLRKQAVAARVLGYVADRQVVDSVVEPIFAESMKRLKLGRDIRKGAVEALGELGDSRGIEPLICTATEDQNDGVRHLAVNALIKHGSLAVEPLMAALAEGASGERKRLAVHVLGQISDKRAVFPLISKLTESDPLLRKSAIEVLGKFGDVRAVDALIVALKDSDITVRVCAATALGQIADAKAAQPMIDALKTENSDSVRCALATSLLKFRDSHPTEVFNAALRFGDSATRLSELKAVAQPLGSWAIEALVAAVADKDEHVRESVVDLLGKVGDVSAVKPLTACLKDFRFRVAMRARNWLVQIGTPAIEMLIAALGDSDMKTRMHVADVLGQIGDKMAVEPLIALIKDNSKYVQEREQVAEALGQIGDARAVGALVSALRDDAKGNKQDLAKAIFKALANIKDTTAVDALVNELNSTVDIRIRWLCASAIVSQGYTDRIRSALPLVIFDWLEFSSDEPHSNKEVEEDNVLDMAASNLGVKKGFFQIVATALAYRYKTASLDKYVSKLISYDDGIQAVNQLCSQADIWSSCALYRVTKKKDIEISLGGCGFPDSERSVKLNYEGARQAARQELIRRGLVETDPITLLQQCITHPTSHRRFRHAATWLRK